MNCDKHSHKNVCTKHCNTYIITFINIYFRTSKSKPHFEYLQNKGKAPAHHPTRYATVPPVPPHPWSLQKGFTWQGAKGMMTRHQWRRLHFHLPVILHLLGWCGHGQWDSKGRSACFSVLIRVLVHMWCPRSAHSFHNTNRKYLLCCCKQNEHVYVSHVKLLLPLFPFPSLSRRNRQEYYYTVSRHSARSGIKNIRLCTTMYTDLYDECDNLSS